MDIRWIPAHSNNFGVGRFGKKVDKIVLHWIVGTLSSADATFQNPDRLASAHYGIGHTKIHQYVKEEDTAWHASNLTVNRQSIGIEHEGGPSLPISEDTIKTSIKLVADICRRYNISADREHIRIHREFSATQCPGTLDVDRIVREVQKLLAVPPTAPPDTIAIPKQDFENMVTKSTQWDEIADYLKVDRLDKQGGKIIVSKFEELQRELESCRNSPTPDIHPNQADSASNATGNEGGPSNSESSNNSGSSSVGSGNNSTSAGTHPDNTNVGTIEPQNPIQTSPISPLELIRNILAFFKKLFS